MKINLLPPELSVDKNLSDVLRLIKSLGLISVVVFFIFIAVVSAIFIISSSTLSSLTNNISKTKSQVLAVETSEQQVVLLKDRIGKIGVIQSFPTSLKNLVAIEPFLSNLGSESLLNELNIDSHKIQLLLTFRTNSDLSTFLNGLSKSDVFKTVTLSSFSLSPASGYSVGVNIEGK